MVETNQLRGMHFSASTRQRKLLLKYAVEPQRLEMFNQSKHNKLQMALDLKPPALAWACSMTRTVGALQARKMKQNRKNNEQTNQPTNQMTN